MLLENTNIKVKFQGTTTEKTNINKGVKQGDPISPTLFNLTLEGIIRKIKLHNKNILADELQIVAYADDVTIIAKSQKGLINAINRLEKEAWKYGLEINEKNKIYENWQ